MAAPASERAAWHWLRQRSALGELLGCDCETMARNALQRASDRLLRHRDTIETRLLKRAADLFDLQPTVTLHDLTNTCFEGGADRQPLARRGHSREKRHDCPPLTLGLALDASGFARRSRVLAGNVAEGGTLQAMPTSLDAPPGAVVVLDRGLATQGNVAWLRERGHRCLVASRERRRVFDESRAVAIGTAGGQRVLACAETDGNGGAGRRAPRDGSADAARGPVAPGHDQARGEGLAAHRTAAGPPSVRRPALRDRRAGRRQGPQRDGGGLEAAAAGGQRGDPSRGPRPAHQQRRLGRRAAVAHLRDADRPGGRPPLPRERTGTAPIHHRRPARSAGHLCLSVLACQLVPVVRQRLRAGGETARWTTRAESGSGRSTRLGVDASPGGVRKLVVQPRRRRENARNAVPHA